MKRTETHLDLLVTGHEYTDVLSMRVGVFLDTGHMTRGKAFVTFDPFIFLKICKNGKQRIGPQDGKGIWQEDCK